VAAAPASSSRTVTGMPSGPRIAATVAAPEPEASAGVRTPRPGTGAMSATSAKAAPVGSMSAASSRLSAAPLVFPSA